MRYHLHVVLIFLSLGFLPVSPISLRKMIIGAAPMIVVLADGSAVQFGIVVPDNYTTIQSAIDAASEGSVIFVKNGTYSEHLEITKSLKIYGSDEGPTILKSPSTWGGDVVHIRANNVTFAKFQIEGTIEESFGAGIYIKQGHHNQILDNVILGNRYGIYLWDSSNTTLRNNNLTNNRFNFGVWGLFLEHFLHDVDISNTIEGKPICYWINEENRTVPLDVGYVALVNSTGIVVKDLDVTSNFQGVVLSYSVFTKIQNVTSVSNYYGIHMLASNNSVIVQSKISNNNVGLVLDLSCNNHIAENNFLNNLQGIMFSYSPLTPLRRSAENCIYKNNIIRNGDGVMIIGAINNRFWGNEITANNRYGVLASSSNYNILYGNTFSTNNWGIWFEKSSSNTVYNNNFINNTSHAYIDTSVNLWNLSQSIGGNYWSDNVILDVNKDGIVDLPYVIDESNIDHYPLAGTFSNHTILWENEEYALNVICNSSSRIFEFFPQQRKASFNFTGPDQTFGFCRISIQKRLVQSLWQDNLTILVNGESPSNITTWEDNASIYVYFTYPHPNSQALVIPEFPSVACLGLFFIFSLIMTILVKRAIILRRREHGKSPC